MATPKWQAGHLYPTGSLVQPKTPIAPVDTTLTNPSFETGDATDWTLGAGTAVNGAKTYTGSYALHFTGSGGATETVHDKVAVTPGTKISASCMYAQGAASSGHNVGNVFLRWYDDTDTPISDSSGTVITSSSGGGWKQSVVSNAQAPAGAASVAIGVKVIRDDSEDSYADVFAWNYASISVPAGLIYKAVQPTLGTSASSEPTWPLTLGVQVIDNTVTWEAVIASRVTWQASPILLSGPTEPDWPTALGTFVADGTISWKTVPRSVAEAPNSNIVALAASKVFAADRDIIRFSATVNPLDWTTEKDAGYIPFGLQTFGSNPCAALGLYRSNLCAFNSEGFQMWQVDEDPANFSLLDALPISSTQHLAMASVANDLLFLSSQGVRSVGISAASMSLNAGDLGIPIDPLVQAAMRSFALYDRYVPISAFVPSMGQYWLAFADYPHVSDPAVPPSDVFVYTMSQIGKVGAWTHYTFRFPTEAFAQLGDELYIRSGDAIFVMDGDRIYDEDRDGDRVEVEAEIRWQYLDFGAPGVTKQMIGFDLVGTGVCDVSIGFTENDYDAVTTPYSVDADTLPGGMIPMPLAAPSFSFGMTFSSADNTDWEWLSSLLYFQDFRMTS